MFPNTVIHMIHDLSWEQICTHSGCDTSQWQWHLFGINRVWTGHLQQAVTAFSINNNNTLIITVIAIGEDAAAVKGPINHSFLFITLRVSYVTVHIILPWMSICHVSCGNAAFTPDTFTDEDWDVVESSAKKQLQQTDLKSWEFLSHVQELTSMLIVLIVKGANDSPPLKSLYSVALMHNFISFQFWYVKCIHVLH